MRDQSSSGDAANLDSKGPSNESHQKRAADAAVVHSFRLTDAPSFLINDLALGSTCGSVHDITRVSILTIFN